LEVHFFFFGYTHLKEVCMIKLDHLTKYYGKNKGIEDLSLKVNEGDIFGFIGPNGAGKSTTIRLLMNFIFPTSGRIEVFGKDLLTSNSDIRKRIGYLPSEVYYYDTVTVKELLDYSGKLKKCHNPQYLKRLIEKFDLDTSRKFGQLSYGNKKKVGIVQAMMHQPDLLILDEPTNGLDPLVQKTLLELLKEENKKGTTVFFSSHTLSVVQKMCNRIGIIKDGQMINVETFDTFKEKRVKKILVESKHFPDELVKKSDISQLIQKDNQIEFYYSGSMNDLFGIISKMDIDDFQMNEPDLEEIFMHFYLGKEGSNES